MNLSWLLWYFHITAPKHLSLVFAFLRLIVFCTLGTSLLSSLSLVIPPPPTPMYHD